MTGFEKSKAFVEEFKQLLDKYKLEVIGYTEPCDEGQYEVWLKEKDNEETGFSFLFGDYGQIAIEDYSKDYDEELYKRSLEEEY